MLFKLVKREDYMFSNILGGKDCSDGACDDKMKNKVSRMNLSEMRIFINNKAEITEEGLVEVLKRLNTKNSQTDNRYIEIDDMDIKIKKGFDLVISIANHKKISVVAVELIQEFIDLYSDIIHKFDTQNKQIYNIKLKEALQKAMSNIEIIVQLKRKMNLFND